MKTFLVFLFLFIVSISSAQIPRTISYQGMLTDETGAPITDGNHSFTIKLYDAAAGGTQLHLETQNVAVLKGVFGLSIGSVIPIPPGLVFDKPYFLGIAIDGGAELTPRTPLRTAPYAFNADHAEEADHAKEADHTLVAEEAKKLSPGATGVVTSINNQNGALTLQGGGGTTVTNNGTTITISSTGAGGTGIQGVQSTDGSLSVTNPNGPVADIKIPANSISTNYILDATIRDVDIADEAVIESKLGNLSVSTLKVIDKAITAAKIGSGAATNGQVLTADGSGGTAWTTLNTTLTLPFTGTVNNASHAFSATQTGTGVAGIFHTNNAANTIQALQGSSNGSGMGIYAYMNGTGEAIQAQVQNAANTKYAVHARHDGVGAAVFGDMTGTGRAGSFKINNAANGSAALEATTNGTGRAANIAILNTANSANALEAGTNGTGKAGQFLITNASNSASVLTASTNGTGLAGNFTITNPASTSYVLSASTTGSGYALSGSSSSGCGVFGISTSFISGYFQNVTAANSSPTLSSSTVGSGPALSSTASGTGMAGEFIVLNAANTSTALNVSTAGIGKGISVALTNSGSNARGIDVTHSGTGTGVFATSVGGNAVDGTTSSISSAGVIGRNTIGEAVVGINRGGTGVGAVVGRNDSSGIGVRGFNTKTGIGVYGQAGISSGTGIAGKFENLNSANSSNTLEVVTNGTGRGINVSSTSSTSTNPGIEVAVSGTSSLNNAAYFRLTNTSSQANCLKVSTTSTNTASDGLEVVAAAGNAADLTNNSSSTPTLLCVQNGTSNIAIFAAGGNKARIDNTGKGFFNGGTQTGGADIAEAFAVVGATSGYEPGDVLVIAKGHKRTVTKCSKPYATAVIGVYATKPGVLLTEEHIDADMTGLVPMGVVGVLPTKVCNEGGAIEAGDLLVTSSKAGYAMKGDPRKVRVGNVLGKALEDFNAATGTINVFVNVK